MLYGTYAGYFQNISQNTENAKSTRDFKKMKMDMRSQFIYLVKSMEYFIQ